MAKRGRSRSRSTTSKRVKIVSVSRPRMKKYKRSYSSRATLGQPKVKTITMPYSAQINLNNTLAGQAAYWQFRANSIFDPDITGSGHQPLSHDQWALFYNHYVVKGCKIVVTFRSNTNIPASYLGIQLNDDTVTDITSGSGSVSNVLENQHNRYKLVNQPAAGGLTKLTYHVNPLKFLNRSKYSTDVKASMGANPTEEAVFTVYAIPFNFVDAIGTNGFQCDVRISYSVELSEPKELTQS